MELGDAQNPNQNHSVIPEHTVPGCVRSGIFLASDFWFLHSLSAQSVPVHRKVFAHLQAEHRFVTIVTLCPVGTTGRAWFLCLAHTQIQTLMSSPLRCLFSRLNKSLSAVGAQGMDSDLHVGTGKSVFVAFVISERSLNVLHQSLCSKHLEGK